MKKVILLLVIIAFMAGCSHPLEIVNKDSFNSSPVKPGKRVKIGFLPTEDRLLNSVIEETSLNATVEVAKKNYQTGSGGDVDYVSGLSKDMKFRSSGGNFFITFPGFIVFTHAWLGYKYYVDIDTHSAILDPAGKVLNESSIATPYEIRYTSFARGTAASLVGWLTPGWGLLNVIPGAMFASSYDNRATPEFIEKVTPSYRVFVSSSVLAQIAKVQQGAASHTEKSHFRMEPVVIGDEIPNDDANRAADDRRYATYVMRVEDGRLTNHTSKLVELSEETWLMLDKIAKKEVTPNEGDIREMLISLGVSEIPLLEDMASVSVYTMQDDKVIALFHGSDADSKIVRK